MIINIINYNNKEFLEIADGAAEKKGGGIKCSQSFATLLSE